LSWGATGPWKYGLLNACYIDGNSLGLGTKFLTRTPEPIESLSEVTQVTAGDRFSLALKSDGRVFGWGSVFGGRLLEQTGMIYKPQELTEVARFLNKKHTHITKICSAGSYTVMLCDNGKLYTFGKSFDGCTGHRQNELINEGDILQHVTPVIDDNYKGQVVSDFKMSPNALIFQTSKPFQ
jgi:alpha-tubulin suppressor-like RCC1 family protein